MSFSVRRGLLTMAFDNDELESDLEEILGDLPQTADVFSRDGAQVVRAVPIAIGDVREEGSTNRAAWREDAAATVTLRADALPFPPDPGTTIVLPDGLRLRVTDRSQTPGDIAVTLTVENRGKS